MNERAKKWRAEGGKKWRIAERLPANPPVLDFTPGDWTLCPWRPKRQNPFTKEWF